MTVVDHLFFFRVSAQYSGWAFFMFCVSKECTASMFRVTCSGSCGCWSG